MTETLDARTETLRNPILEPTPSNPEPPRLVNHRRKPAAAIQNRKGRAHMKEGARSRAGEGRGEGVTGLVGAPGVAGDALGELVDRHRRRRRHRGREASGKARGELGAGTKWSTQGRQRWSGVEAKGRATSRPT